MDIPTLCIMRRLETELCDRQQYFEQGPVQNRMYVLCIAIDRLNPVPVSVSGQLIFVEDTFRYSIDLW